MPSFRPQHFSSSSVPARYPLKGEPIYTMIKDKIRDMDDNGVAGSLEQLYPPYIPRGEICPICKMPFDKGKKRKLVDQCGHEKCYSCLFKSDKCLICALQAPPKKVQHFMPRIPFSVSIGRSKLKTNGTFFSQRATNPDPGLPPEHPSPRQSLFSAFSTRRQASIANLKSGRKTPLSDVDLSFSSIPDRATSDSNSTLCDVKSFDSDRNPSSHTDSDDLYASFSLLKSSVYSPRSSLKMADRVRAPMTNSFSSLSTFSSEANTSSGSSSPPQARRNKPVIPKSLEVILKPLFFEVPQEHPDPLFIGRSWLFNEIEQKLKTEGANNKGIVIAGQTGTGKTAAILQMLDYSCFGRKREERMYQDIYSRSDPNGSVDFIPEGVWPLSQMVVAYHFCQADNAITCHIPDFIHSIAAQLCQAPQLYAYRDMFLSDTNLQSLLSLSSCIKDPDVSFVKGILEPLHSLRRLGKIATDPLAILIDGLCEAEYHNPEYGGSLAQFVTKHVAKIPNFLKLIVTVRTEFKEITNSFPFHTTSLDPNIEGPITDPAIKDLIDYVSFRCSHSPTIQSNVNSTQNNGSSIQKFIKHIVYLSRGSMLYLKLLIDLIERGHLVIKSGSFKVLPQTLNEIFMLHFNLKFPSVESFEKVSPILNVCLASLSPLTLPEIFHSVNSCFLYQFLTWEEFLARFKTLDSFLIKRIDDTYMLFHPAMKEWLRRRADFESQKFVCQPRQGHACIALRMSRLEWPLDADKTLELGHHILKAHLYKSGVSSYESNARDLQALWVAKSGHDLSAALSHHRNVYSPNLKVSRLLLIAGASPDFPPENPLITVCASLGHTEMLTLLLEFGASANIKDNDGRTAVIRAASEGHCDIVNLLYQSGADLAITDAGSNSALGAAARAGHVNVVAFLLSCNWQMSQEDLAKFVVNALVCAVEAGHLNIVEYLLEMADIDVDAKDKISGHSAVSMAAHAGRAKIAAYLILMGASINTYNDFNELPITCAVGQGHYETLELLLKEGVPVDACDVSDTTPLMIASREGLLAIMELLFSYGASLSKVNADGLTALDLACQNGHIHAITYLADRGADINHVDKFGRTALDLSASHGDPTVVQYLLDRGAAVEHVDINGLRPLDKAIAAGNISAIQCFLKKGAKLGPSTWSMATGKSHILIMLLNKLQEDGVTLCKRGKIKEAAHRFSYALRKLPVNSAEDDATPIFEQLKLHLILNLSRCKRKLNDVQESVNLAEKAIELKPSSYEAFYARARAHKESGNSRQAIQDITTALTLVPPSVKGIRQVLVRIRQEMIDDN